jgi:cytohesin
MELGADVNQARDDGVTALYIAAQLGHETVVRAMIEAGADVNQATEEGDTPLSASPTFEIAQILRNAGAV